VDGRLKPIRDIAPEKPAWRRAQARLPFEEKFRTLVSIRRRCAPIVAARGGRPEGWSLDHPRGKAPGWGAGP
jgi:hypothetical protein